GGVRTPDCVRATPDLALRPGRRRNGRAAGPFAAAGAAPYDLPTSMPQAQEMGVDCLFCKIAEGQVPATLIHEGEEIVAFRDINPQAPLHVLVIPRRHIASVNELAATDAELVGNLVNTAREIAAREGVAESGYRLVFN